jgi:hypothetical protein
MDASDERAFHQAHNSNNRQDDPCGARWALWPMFVVVDEDRNGLIRKAPGPTKSPRSQPGRQPNAMFTTHAHRE